jgi:hypothetical protein
MIDLISNTQHWIIVTSNSIFPRLLEHLLHLTISNPTDTVFGQFRGRSSSRKGPYMGSSHSATKRTKNGGVISNLSVFGFCHCSTVRRETSGFEK